MKGESYTKTEGDQRYQAAGNYQAAGYGYSKAESDNAYQPKGNYQAASYSYSKQESDARYLVMGNRGVSNALSGVKLNDGESANLNLDYRGKIIWVHANKSYPGGAMTIVPHDNYQVTTHHGAQGRITLTLLNNGRTVKVIYTQSDTRLNKIDVWN